MNHFNTLILDAFWVDNKTFPTEQLPNSNIGRAFHEYYHGEARHLGWMDLPLLKKLIKKHSISHIILQNLGALGKIAKVTEKKVLVCVGYTYKKHYYVPSVQKARDLKKCEPIYTDAVLGDWEFSDDDAEIPNRAQQYMRYLLVHTRVDSITCMTNKVKFTVYFDNQGNVESSTESNS